MKSLTKCVDESCQQITSYMIGEAKAKKIIEYRDQNGLFKTIEDIKNVPGIGENIFAQIKDYITTG